MINRKELIKKYLDFFKSKNHKEVPNKSLIPENDPTVLFTTAGMHPLIPYLLGQPHPLGKRLCNIQKCVRTSDIEEVGDNYHHTFIEMLGNWSLGDYWKKQAIEYSFEFLTKILKIPIEKIAVTCFKGNKNSQKDNESAKIWKSLGIKIIEYLEEDNWWGPAGETGPCGPSTEVFYWTGKNKALKEFDPNISTLATDGGNWVEIGNNVLMEYNKTKKGFEKAKQKNIDFGGGVERIVTILNGLEDDYLSDTFKPIIKKIEELSKKKYKGNEKAMRIIADHIKAATFILAEGIMPSNTEQGYVLRRLIRRAIKYGKDLGMKEFTTKIAEIVFDIYPDYFPKKDKKIRFVNRDNKTFILDEIEREESKFEITLEKGMNKFKRFASKGEKLSGKDAFLLYQSYGFPIEMTREIASKEWGCSVNIKDFEKEYKKHQKLSRTARAGKFKSGLADYSETTTKLHTAAHLLLSALRIILKDKNITQKGSNITPERLRLDFSFPRKVTKDEQKKIEDLVNAQIQKSIRVIKEEMPLEKAKKKGASGVFDEKYKEKVSVYTIGNFSKEICAGPHVKNTNELGYFKIKKEESSGAGVRRIKAILE